MNAWQALPDWLARETAVMLVTVASVRGSTPREAGASMLVGAHTCCDTIGGGRLEWEAISHARELLARPESTPALLRLPLAASLGQCCGGVVWLLFERIHAREQSLWQARVAALAAGGRLLRECSNTLSSSWNADARPDTDHGPASGASLEIGDAPGFRSAASGLHTAGIWHFHQSIALQHFPITIFGAGHVGEAIVRALLPLQAQIRWVDTREDVFPADLARQVLCIQSDQPEQELLSATPGSNVLILTHSHAIDLELCAAGLKRSDLAFLGLIGSHAKRTRFEQRLLLRGFTAAQLATLCCPIGIAGIRSKQPAVIAASVVAQLLLLRDQTPCGGRVAHSHPFALPTMNGLISC